jgi:hypothetical protein
LERRKREIDGRKHLLRRESFACSCCCCYCCEI